MGSCGGGVRDGEVENEEASEVNEKLLRYKHKQVTNPRGKTMTKMNRWKTWLDCKWKLKGFEIESGK